MMRYIEINGDKYPIALNIITFEAFAEDVGVSINDIDSALTGPRQIRNTITLIRHMMSAGAALSGDEFSINDAQLAARIGMDMTPIEQAMEVLADFMPEQDSKKKIVRKAREKRSQ